MLIVLQGPRGSGKTTLASAITKIAGKRLMYVPSGMQVKESLPHDIFIYDNLDPTKEDVLAIHQSAREYKINIIVTTCINWSEWSKDDYVIKMTPILPSDMRPQSKVLSQG